MDALKSPAKNWYLVYCKPRQEISAKFNLERQGYQVFLPMIRVQNRVQGKRVSSIVAMFPRYLFIRLAQGFDNLAPIRSTIGVSHLVKFGLETVKVPDELIELLKSRENKDGMCEIQKTKFKAGDRFRISEGVMEGYEGVVLARSGKDRVRLMLDAINVSISSLEMFDEQLEQSC